MNTTDLLEQMLRGGQSSMSAGAGRAGGGLGDMLGGLLSAGRGAPGASGAGGLGSLLGGLGGLLGGGASGRGGGNYAALASLGMMAYQAYQSWQQKSAVVPQSAFQTVDQLQGEHAEVHSHAILCALIAGAKADGKLDDQETQIISDEIGRHTDEPELQQWIDKQAKAPLDAGEVAKEAHGDPAIASEMYLASVMVTGQLVGDERRWLDDLAAALGLDAKLQSELERRVAGGGAA